LTGPHCAFWLEGAEVRALTCAELHELGVPLARCPACAETRSTRLYCTACQKPLSIVRAHAFFVLDDGAKTPIASWHVVHAQPECREWRSGGLTQAQCVPETPYGTTLEDFCKSALS
jgi:hypothetical protein